MSRGIRLPPETLRETYDEVVAAGSQRAVAHAHGWHQSKVKHRVESYMRHAGIAGLPPGIVSEPHARRATLSHSGQGARSGFRRAEARIRDLEAENAALRARVAELAREAAPWAGVHARLAAIERAIAARPIAMAAPTHRRIADGGARVRDQRRGAA